MKTAPEHESDDPGREENHDKHKKLTDEEGCHCYDGTYPAGPLPPPPILKKIEHEDDEEKSEEKKDEEKKDEKGKKKGKGGNGKDGIDKAMQILDEYYEGVPLRNPKFDHGGED